MIPILYAAGSNDFSNDGIGMLSDALSCFVEEERNGPFECELTYPTSGVLYDQIKNDCIIKAKANDNGNDQLFRVYKITKPINRIVTVYAEHISYLLNGNPVFDWSIEGSAQAAITSLLNNALFGHSFQAFSNINDSRQTSLPGPQMVRGCLFGQTGSVLDVWGGEFEWDNFRVCLYEHRGNNNGVSLEYGKNITDLTQEEEIGNTCTCIVPYAKQTIDRVDHYYYLADKYIDAPNADKFSHQKAKLVDFSEKFQNEGEQITPTESELYELGQDYIQRNQIGVPNVSLTVKYLELLEKVSLCDTVTVDFPALGVSATAKVTRIKYNTLLERVEEAGIGEARPNFAKSYQETVSGVDKLPSSMQSAMYAAVQNSTGLITGADGGHVVIKLDENKKPQEILIMDSEYMESAQKVWRWNINGFGYSSSGVNGPYETAITMDGAIVANFITTGKIASKTGAVYFDLDANNGKGELAASILKGVEEGSTTTARIGVGTYSGGETYEGMSVRTSSGAGGGIIFALDRSVGDYALANNSEIFSSGNLTIRSQAISTNPGGNNSINLYGNSDTGEGLVEIRRGTPDGSEQVLYAKEDQTALLHKGEFVFVVDDIALNIRYKQDNIMIGQDDATIIRFQDNDRVKVYQDLIQFVTGGYARASIENDGAYFADLYSNGSLVTSDRKKKTNIKKLTGRALDKVKGSPVYRYKLKKEMEPDGNSIKAKAKTLISDKESIGLIYDEAPEEIRRESAKGDKAIDLYGMASILWKSVQELNDKVENLSERINAISIK